MGRFQNEAVLLLKHLAGAGFHTMNLRLLGNELISIYGRPEPCYQPDKADRATLPNYI
jgi:hypothetical protein